MSRRAYRVFFGHTTGRLSGVDVFSAHLVTELTRRGVEARILHTVPPSEIPDPLPFPDRVAAETLETGSGGGWRSRWRALRRHLERAAPCVYFPNYDWNHAAIAPVVPDRVAIVGSVHSDDPRYYEQLDRLGRYWNAVVAVSARLFARAAATAPDSAGRLRQIPYGVPVPARPPSPGRGDGVLRVVYAGRLVEYQKRVLRLVEIVEELQRRGVAFDLTIAGSGPEEERLRTALAAVPGAPVRFVGTLPNRRVPELLRECTALVLTSDFEGLPLSLLEAMAQGTIPVVARIRSGVGEVVEDGGNGFLVAGDDASAYADRLAALAGDPILRARLSRAAWQTMRAGAFRIERVAEAYLELLDAVVADAAAGRFKRPRAAILPPPAMEAELSRRRILPRAGRALARRGRQVLARPLRSAPAVAPASPRTGPPAVVVGTPVWSLNGVNIFALSLVRELRRSGVEAGILVTDPERLDPKPLPRPPDVPLDELVAPRWGGERRRLAALKDHLEARAPCIYLPNHDYRHSAVCAALSDRVSVVGIVHSDDPEHYAHAMRAGRFWDAAVAVTPAIAAHLAALAPDIASRVRSIPYGVEPSREPAERTRSDTDPLRLVYAGRLIQQQKRVLDLPRILRALDDRQVAASLDVIGDGPDRQRLEEQLAAWLATGRVRFLGILSHEETRRALAARDVLLLTSAYEGLPMALLEAMAAGCVPVVADFETGIAELPRDGVNGYRVAIGDVEAFAERIRELQREPALCARMAAAARATVIAGYTARRMAEDYLGLFTRLATAS